MQDVHIDGALATILADKILFDPAEDVETEIVKLVKYVDLPF